MKEGTLAIKLANDGGWEWDNIKRFFYGINKKKRYCFANEPLFKLFNAKNRVEGIRNHGRYESKTQYVHFKTKTRKTSDYIFSANIFISVTELHDLYNDISNYWYTVKFMICSSCLDIKNIGVKPYCSIEINYSHSPIYIYH